MSSPLSPRSQAAFAADARQLADEITCAHGSFIYAVRAAERAAAIGSLGNDLIAAASTAAVNFAKAADSARLLAESLTTQIAEIKAAEDANAERIARRRSNNDAAWKRLMAERTPAKPVREAALRLQFGDRTYWDALDDADPDRSRKTSRESADEASGTLSRRDDGCTPRYNVLIQNVPLSWGIPAISNWLRCLERSPDKIDYHVPRPGSGVVLTFDSKAAADVAWRYLDDRRLMDGGPSTITTWLA